MAVGLLSFAAIFAFGISIGPHAFNETQAMWAGIVWLFGLVALSTGTVYLLIARRVVGPQGTVRRRFLKTEDETVEIWGLHPAFVVAVHASNAKQPSIHQAAERSGDPW